MNRDGIPGFFVTAVKDIHSEVTQAVALSTIGDGASAFLHLNSPATQTVKARRDDDDGEHSPSVPQSWSHPGRVC